MIQAVDADLKSMVGQMVAEFRRNGISLWYKIETRPKPQIRFDFHQLAALFMTFRRIHIVGQHQSKLFPFGPPGPWRRWHRSLFVYRPDVFVKHPFMEDDSPPQKNLQPSWDKGP
jgi:hypothetical protein